ncbi:hypothetical protein IWX87_003888 [Polaromonas sp. CG_9.7]|nr:hypothetical protein [Polaromonas sp. CG_23.6]MBG6074100.1 hypothetical protein [Polaromonas sp. CG_9.7]MBG6116111.1 hypothetical protein [Polaromonas sp. CG_9.2]MDH6182870.1 hypothetical protein [Polaromonas sp. CG_23.6]
MRSKKGPLCGPFLLLFARGKLIISRQKTANSPDLRPMGENQCRNVIFR